MYILKYLAETANKNYLELRVISKKDELYDIMMTQNYVTILKHLRMYIFTQTLFVPIITTFTRILKILQSSGWGGGGGGGRDVGHFVSLKLF